MEDSVEALKQKAARRAGDWIRDGMVLGLGSGTTMRYLLNLLAEKRAAGEWLDLVGVPTSEETAHQAREMGIPLTDFSQHPRLDLAIDGADEVDPEFRLIKGLGGALLREKIVATASAALLILVDESKLVQRLGTRAPLPVEVVPFGAPLQPAFLRSLGAQPVLRSSPGGDAFRTDSGNLIYDCHFPDGIADPASLAAALDGRVGVVEHGLFRDLATSVIVAAESGTRVLGQSPAQGTR